MTMNLEPVPAVQDGEVLPPAGTFDYTGLSPEVATEVQAAEERIRNGLDRQHESIIEIGCDLLAVKKRLGHGQFSDWLKAKFGLTVRTAQNYMQVAERFGGKSETVSHLPPTALYKLAAPSTPTAAATKILEKLEAGEQLDRKAIDSIVFDAQKQDLRAKEAKAEEARLVKLTPEYRKKKATAAEKQRLEMERQHQERERQIQDCNAQTDALVAKIVALPGDDLKRLAAEFPKADWREVGRALNKAAAK
jgi:Protein of unknown function (DUF3102)